MWIILTGYFLSVLFENKIIELYKNKIPNTIFSIFIKWLFQEYIEDEFYLNSGKYFMIDQEFRNKFIIQSLKILINIIIYSHIITLLEFGTFLIFFCLWFTILFKTFLPKFQLNKKNMFIKLKILDFNIKFNEIFLFISFYIFFNQGFLKIYYWFDLFFIFRPLIIILLLISNVFFIYWLVYVIYLSLLYDISKNLSLIIKVFITKLHIYILYLIVFIKLIIYEINIQNLVTMNFFKEIFFKIILIFV